MFINGKTKRFKKVPLGTGKKKMIKLTGGILSTCFETELLLQQLNFQSRIS